MRRIKQRIKPSPNIIHPYGGLCNRLRSILSALDESPESNISVIWDVNPEVSNAHFLDVFEPISTIVFIEKGKGLRTCYALNDKWRAKAMWLIPIFDIREKVKSLCRSMGPNFIALHIRRTDFSDRLNSHSYETYFSFIDKNSLITSIYLATDNSDTLNVFKQRYPGRIINNSLFDQSSKRQTSFQDAVIDLFVCANATVFQGTESSSFSEMILSLSEGLKNKTILTT